MDDIPSRLNRGYEPNFGPSVKAQMKRLGESSLKTNIMWAFLYLLSIPALGIAVGAAIAVAPTNGFAVVLIVAAYVAAALLIARQQRGLELMVHDASHKTWYRLRPDLNNLCADLLVAYPVLSSVASYWNSHRVHHAHYGASLDPCRQRFHNMGLGHLDLSSRWKIAEAVLRWLPAYNAAYYKEIGSASLTVWRNFAAWHLIVFIVPTTAALILFAEVPTTQATAYAFLAWIGFWMIPAIAVLPVLRSIAESEEHDYERGETEFGTTFTNTGWAHFLFFHPFNDPYHLIHHMFPAIPAVNHHKVHRLLMRHDPAYRAALHRTKVLKFP